MKKLQVITDTKNLSELYTKIVKEDFREISIKNELLNDTLNGCSDEMRGYVKKAMREISITLEAASKYSDNAENLLAGNIDPMKFLLQNDKIKRSINARISYNKRLPLHK